MIETINADFMLGQEFLKDETIDLVYTDPPYLKKYLYTYQYLADYCPRIMRRGASLMCIAAHYALPEIVKYFDGKLKYRWTMCMNQEDGSHPRMAMGIEVMWKPILWYVKGSYPSGRGFIKDMIHISQPTKKLHKWQQDESWAEFYISKLTQPGDLVLDPYVGSGTVARVCKKLNRNFMGFEIDPEAYATAKKSIEEYHD